MEFTTKFKTKTKSSTLRMKLALRLGVSYYTIIRMLADPSNYDFTKLKNASKIKNFTKEEYLIILSEIFDINESEIFDKN